MNDEVKSNANKKEPIHIISLGAGVQSSTMALMAAHGEITPMPVAAIFADTQCEEQQTYDWLDVLTTELPFPVYKVTKGNLGKDFITAIGTEKGRCGQPPFFVKSKKDLSMGILWRKCTQEYKLAPIRKKVRELIVEHAAESVNQMIGISLDEAHRMKDSGVNYVHNVYPLIDLRISRIDCLKWLKKHGYPEPPKSACVFCPYHSDSFWLKMKQNRPVQLKHKLNGAKIHGTIFLHRSGVNLRDAIFDPNESQLDMFGNECEGMCGV